jgi:hypothetical protein
VSSNRAHGEVYSIQHYVIKFVSFLSQVGGFLRVLRFLPSAITGNIAVLVSEVILKEVDNLISFSGIVIFVLVFQFSV